MDTREHDKQAIRVQLQQLTDAHKGGTVSSSTYQALSLSLRTELVIIDKDYQLQQAIRNSQAGAIGPSGPTSYLCNWYFDKTPYINHANTRAQGAAFVIGQGRA